VFKLRCRVTEIKIYLKRKYDMLECDACGNVEETQEYKILCTELKRNRKVYENKYEKLINETAIEKLKIAGRFKENFDILEKMKK
jgi:hypothetical protein